MRVTPDNIIQQELVGLRVHVSDSNDKSCICKKGIVVDESKEMLYLSDGPVQVCLQKRASVFEFMLQNGEVVRVRGDLLRGRPEERMKRRQLRRW